MGREFLGNPNRLQICSSDSPQDHREFFYRFYDILKRISLTINIRFASLLFCLSLCANDIFFGNYVLDNPSFMLFINLSLGMGI